MGQHILKNKQKRILVTGGSGFIGSELINELIATNYKVLNVSTSKGRENILTQVASICDLPNLKGIFNKFTPHIVVHCAGATAKYYKQNPVNALNNQIIGTRNIIAASNEFGCEKIVFLSSNHVYIGFNEKDEVDETVELKFSLDPYNYDYNKLYGFSKYISETVCLNGFKNSIILRLASIYGEGKSSNLIKGMLYDSKKLGYITIWGNGNRRIQFTYLPDVITAIVKSMQVDPGIYNIANHEMIKTVDVAKTIGEVLNVKWKIDKDKPAGSRFPYASNKKFISKTNDFSYTEFSIGIQKYIGHYDN